MTTSEYAILSESGGYKVRKNELDEETTQFANDAKLTAATNDTVTIASIHTNVAAIQSYLAGKYLVNSRSLGF